MARRSKLLAALDTHKGRDYKVEKQKKIQKRVEKKKKLQSTATREMSEPDLENSGGVTDGPRDSFGSKSDERKSDENAAALSREVCRILAHRLTYTKQKSASYIIAIGRRE